MDFVDLGFVNFMYFVGLVGGRWGLGGCGWIEKCEVGGGSIIAKWGIVGTNSALGLLWLLYILEQHALKDISL